MGRRSRELVALCAALGISAGCGGSARDDSPFDTMSASGGTSPTTSAENDTGDAVDDDGTVTGEGSSDVDDEDPIFDVGLQDVPAETPCGPDEDCGCNAVDLLFVVDNSGSMNTHRAAVIAAFPTFVEEMFSALPSGTDLHVGLTRATGFYDPGNSGGWGGPTCEASITDGVFVPPDEATHGENGQQGRLFEHDGQRFFAVDTSGDPGPLHTWFDGALTGVIDGFAPHSNTETVVAGAAYPFHPSNAGHNEGFMRTNAVLVLFLLSDSPDLTPANVPTSQLIDIVRDAKAECGGDTCIVTSGAIAGACFEQAGNTNTRLTEFMNAFGGPPASWVDLGFAPPDFSGVLGTALADVVATACEEVPPEG